MAQKIKPLYQVMTVTWAARNSFYYNTLVWFTILCQDFGWADTQKKILLLY